MAMLKHSSGAVRNINRTSWEKLKEHSIKSPTHEEVRAVLQNEEDEKKEEA